MPDLKEIEEFMKNRPMTRNPMAPTTTTLKATKIDDRDVSPIESALKSLQSTAESGEIYARNIREDLAKSWANGEHKPAMRALKPGEDYTQAERNAWNAERRGVSIEGAIDIFSSCLFVIKDFEQSLSSTPGKVQAADIYDAYDDALDKYWAFIQKITDGLNQDGVRKYLGTHFKVLFENHITAFQAPGNKIIEVIGPLLDTETPHAKRRGATDMSPDLKYMNKPQTPENLRSWTDRTNQYLKDGLAAATG